MTYSAVRYGVFANRVEEPPVPPVPVPPPPPEPPDDPVRRAQFEADAARAETAKLKKQLDDIQKQLPSEEQRAEWATLKAEKDKAEEERLLKKGEFDNWRISINAKHDAELQAERQNVANEAAKAAANEKELNDTLIGLSFSGATEWFGPSGKTVLLPEVAKSYFSHHVTVEVAASPHGGPPARRVLVKDYNGTVILDAKTGKPASFNQAIGELIELHPQKNQLLRGSGKVGSGSTGGDHAAGGRDLSRLKPSDFKDPATRAAVRDQLTAPGGLHSPGFDAIEQKRRQTKP